MESPLIFKAGQWVQRDDDFNEEPTTKMEKWPPGNPLLLNDKPVKQRKMALATAIESPETATATTGSH